MSIITVSGEKGSLRDELCQEICERGGLECINRAALMDAVQGLVEVSRDELQLLAEQGPALLDLGPRRRRVFAAFLESVVLQYAQAGGVVLVGRGTNLLLRLVPGVLRVRTVAPLELRAQRIANAEGLELDQARRLATAVDQQRRAYVGYVFGADWASPLNYDLVLNMGRLSVEQAALTVLDLAAHADYQPSGETARVMADLVLAGRVRCTLVEAVDIHALEVECAGGRVRLLGYVASREELARAARLAGDVKGVEKVVNELEVAPTMVDRLG